MTCLICILNLSVQSSSLLKGLNFPCKIGLQECYNPWNLELALVWRRVSPQTNQCQRLQMERRDVKVVWQQRPAAGTSGALPTSIAGSAISAIPTGGSTVGWRCPQNGVSGEWHKGLPSFSGESWKEATRTPLLQWRVLKWHYQNSPLAVGGMTSCTIYKVVRSSFQYSMSLAAYFSGQNQLREESVVLLLWVLEHSRESLTKVGSLI